MKAKKTTRKKPSRNFWVYAFALILITLITIYAVEEYLNMRPPTVNPKREAAEYFSFSEIGGEGTIVSADIIRVKTLHFGLTPKEGNATHLNILASGMTDTETYIDLSILMNETRYFDLPMGYPVQIRRQGSGFPFAIKLVSAEAEGKVTLNITLSNFFPL